MTSRDILRIALPAAAGLFGLFLFEFVDIFWIAKLGSDATAGLAAAGFIQWVVFSLMSVTSSGASALIAQARGQGNRLRIFQIAHESVQLSCMVSVVISVILVLFGEIFLTWMGLEPQAFLAGQDYLKVFAWGNLAYYVFHIFGYIFNAHGDTKTAVSLLGITLLLNAVLDPLLIFGWGPFPEWGVFGASVASCLSCVVGCWLSFYYLHRRNYVDVWPHFFIPSRQFYKDLLQIGIPTALSRVIKSVVYPLLTAVITRFGMVALAGLTISNRIENLAYFTACGFSIAMTTMVGHATGGGDLHAVRSITYRGLRLITFVLLPFSCLFVFAPRFLMELVTKDASVVEEGIKYLVIVGSLEIFLGWEMIFEGSFGGIGRTFHYMWISLPLTLSRFPLAYLCVVHWGMGITSIWWVIALTTVVKGLVMGLVFFKTKPRWVTSPQDHPRPSPGF